MKKRKRKEETVKEKKNEIEEKIKLVIKKILNAYSLCNTSTK